VSHQQRYFSLGLVLLSICSVLFIVRGYISETHTLHSRDFKPVYAASRCLLAGCNPYDIAATKQEYLGAGNHGGQPCLPTTQLNLSARDFLSDSSSSMAALELGGCCMAGFDRDCYGLWQHSLWRTCASHTLHGLPFSASEHHCLPAEFC
jgi:hypothetical protein